MPKKVVLADIDTGEFSGKTREMLEAKLALGVRGVVVETGAETRPAGDVVVWIDPDGLGAENALATDPVVTPGASSAGAIMPGKRSGEYLFNAVSGGQANAPSTLDAGTLYCVPFYNPGAPFDIDRILMKVHTGGAAGAVVRLGIYTVAGNGRIGDRLFDSGAMSATTNDQAREAVANVTIPSGAVLLVLVTNDSTVKPYRVTGDLRSASSLFWRGRTADWPPEGRCWIKYTGYVATSALPATGTTAGEEITGEEVPMILVRVA